MVFSRKKLIEVALPLHAINVASTRERSVRHTHPSKLHLWWARKTLATARAVIFAQMVDDPSGNPNKFPSEESRKEERQRLFKLIEKLIKWENTTNEQVLSEAREEILKNWHSTCVENAKSSHALELFDPRQLPAFHDPFAGGGTLPLEAQRLGLASYASDLNPVAVLINKAMIEIPPKFAGQPPINPEFQSIGKRRRRVWKGGQGLAEDVHYYGRWLHDEAESRIGHLYPKIEVTAEMAENRFDLEPLIGQRLTVIAWLWVRTVKSPNPAIRYVDVPLASTFMLSSKVGKEAYVDPKIEGNCYHFTVKLGKPENAEAAKNGTKLLQRGSFRCLLSNSPISDEYIRAEGLAGRIGNKLLAIVAEGKNGRIYLSPTEEHGTIAQHVQSLWQPETSLPRDSHSFSLLKYGFRTYSDLFSRRQLVTLSIFSDLVQEVRNLVQHDAVAVGIANGSDGLGQGNITNAQAYADALAIYLSLSIDKTINYNATLVSWNTLREQPVSVLNRPSLAIVWNYAEVNPFAGTVGDIGTASKEISEVLEHFISSVPGIALCESAQAQELSLNCVISTAPPISDSVGYADLSDFFYVWLHRSLRNVLPSLFTTPIVPKAEELVAISYRHSSREKAEDFVLDGMSQAMRRVAEQAHPAFPVTIYYSGKASSKWAEFLSILIKAGLSITGIWPIRADVRNYLGKAEINTGASTIILVCRARQKDAPTATKGEFLFALKRELSLALTFFQDSNIAPIDLHQAAIGSGMSVFTRYTKVFDLQNNVLTVSDSLFLIEQTMNECFVEQRRGFDPNTQWALDWFERFGFNYGSSSTAEKLARAKNTNISALIESDLISSSGNKICLVKSSDLSKNVNLDMNSRLTTWALVQYLIAAFEQKEIIIKELVTKLGIHGENARKLAYLLYMLCQREERTAEAFTYNKLVQLYNVEQSSLSN